MHMLSIDPGMRGWIAPKRSYMPPVKPGEVMRGFGVGTVLESNAKAFAPGDVVTGLTGIQTTGVVDAMFLLARITGQGTPIDVPGVRGWMAPTSEAYLSRIGLTELRDADCRVRAVRARFEKEGKGLTWVVSGADRDARIPELLLSHGFRPARFAQIAGMHLQAPFPTIALAPGIRIEEIPEEEIEGHMGIIAHAIGMSRPSPNPLRAGGALISWGLILGLSLWALWLGLGLQPPSPNYI
jgi:hypothetical protein